MKLRRLEKEQYIHFISEVVISVAISISLFVDRNSVPDHQKGTCSVSCGRDNMTEIIDCYSLNEVTIWE